MTWHYTKEIKEDIVKYVFDHPEFSHAQIADAFDVNKRTLDGWITNQKKYNQTKDFEPKKGLPVDLTSSSSNSSKDNKKRIKELEMEVKVLKAAAAYFAKDALPKVNTLL